ncbi:MAG TPA: chalcone isomerase family protein [Burkholderiales bacterium]|nr:chalcone isomerase family protein [Burkholderiales bacterium]
MAGVKLPEEDQKLVLNGAGLRKRVFFQVYVIGLYLPEKKTAAAEAIGAAGPKRIAMHMLRDVGADQFGGALTDGMKDNNGEAEMKALQPRIQQLLAAMNEMKEAKKGMRITLDWVPAAGTQLTVDGKPSGAPIPGEDFYRALLRIWLGERPVQDDLKKALLGEMSGSKP